MKKLKQRIFLGIMLIVLVVFGVEIFGGYMAEHTYYFGMLHNSKHWWMIIWSVIASLIPVWYLLLHKTFKLRKFIIYLILGLLVFSFAHVILKGGFVSAGSIVYIVNIILLFSLGAYFISGSLVIGNRISQKLLKFKQTQREEMLINFGIGLGSLLFVVRLLIVSDLFFSGLIWIIFVGLGIVLYLQKNEMKKYSHILTDIFGGFKKSQLKQHKRKWIGLVLLVFSIMYYFYGFQLSFIPYSTAWDANHAYMYLPKIWSLNHGVFWSNGPGGTMPGLWHSFIAFWFALIKPISSWVWLKGDTIAVAMNFLSGIFVLVFGLGLMKKVLDFVSRNIKVPTWIQDISFSSAWFFLLLWLSSGMGAFLVFVDNKTDLGLMAMIILAMFSGFIFLRHIAKDRAENHDSHSSKMRKESVKYVVVSAFMFALAALTKVTATTDILIFTVLLLGLWFNVWLGISSGFLGLFLVTLVKPANAKDLLLANTPLTHIFLVLAGISAVVGILLLIKNLRIKNYVVHIKRSLRYGLLWLGSIALVLIVAKGSILIIQQLKTEHFDTKALINGMLFAQTNGITTLNQQTAIDQKSLPPVSLQACKQLSVSDKELSAHLKEPPTQNEDVGRYIGYGRKEFKKPQGIFRLGYGILKLFYHQDGKCYGFDDSAVVLCEHAHDVDTFNASVLGEVLTQMPKDSVGYTLLSKALAHYKENYQGISGEILVKRMRDDIVALRQFYKTNAIVYLDATATTPETILIPYKYIVPLNVVYNRSLQNLSSYYTDIGFVWLFLFAITILALIYAMTQKDEKLIMLASTSLFGRGIRWIIGGGIVRYGIGLITWLIMIMMIFFKNVAEDIVDDTHVHKNNNAQLGLYFVIGLLLLRGMIQFVLNLVRISSQGASGPFIWYKMDAGNVTTYNDQLQPSTETKLGYSQKDVFDMQFPHYNRVINYLKERKDEDGVLIAGTYLQYFLNNQKYLKLDGMLSSFAKTISDGDSCYSYKRLKEQHLKYFVIDPNIGTVVMGEGNEALFQRFFAKIDPVNGLIQEQGAISMFVKMRKDGYVHMLYSSNLGAKYAFQLPDDIIKSVFGDLSEGQLMLIRAKLSIARFFPKEPALTNFIANVFSSRIQNGAGIGDIADVYGKEIDEAKVFAVAKAWTSARGYNAQIATMVKDLSQDERLILSQYLALYNMMQNNQSQYQSSLQNILRQSLAGSSQLIVFELAD